MNPNSPALAARLTHVHLLYLSLLPAIGTALLLIRFHVSVHPLLALILGTAAVGIYLAVTTSYLKPSSSVWKNLFTLLDGPTWALSTLFVSGSLATALVDGILIEISSILIGMMVVVLTSNRPSPSERLSASVAVGLPLLGMLFVCWRYLSPILHTDPLHILLICAAVLQGSVTYFRMASDDIVYRDASGFIIIGIIAWTASLFLGYAFMG